MSTHTTSILTDSQFQSFLDCGLIIQIPELSLFYIGIGEADLDLDNYFFTQNFFGNKCEKSTPKEILVVEKSHLLDLVLRNLKEKCIISEVSNDDDLYQSDTEQVLSLLNDDSSFSKFVTISKADFKWNKVHPLSQLKNLLELNGSLYGRWNDKCGHLGVSPEPLIVKKDKYWKTRSLAGTISMNKEGYEETLMSDSKEIFEHQLVVKDIKEKLDMLNFKTDVKELRTIPFGDIAHLCTDINWQTDDDNFLDVVKAVSPTAALGAYPSSALHHLKELQYYENHKDERVFGGVFGLVTGNKGMSLVIIRNIFWDQNFVQVHSGTGIVKDSIVENELDEVLIKRRSVVSCFQ